MGIKGIIFILIAISAAAVNFSSHKLSEKTGASELKIKLLSLGAVVASVSLLMIFGK